jgi:hypothetical protein
MTIAQVLRDKMLAELKRRQFTQLPVIDCRSLAPFNCAQRKALNEGMAASAVVAMHASVA